MLSSVQSWQWKYRALQIEPRKSRIARESERESFFEELRRKKFWSRVRSDNRLSGYLVSRKVKKIVSDSEKTKDRTSEENNSGGVGQGETGPGQSGPIHSTSHCGSSGVSTLVPNNSPTHHIPNTPNEVTNLTNQTTHNWNGNLVMYPTQPNPNPTGGTYPHYLTTCYPFVQESYYFLPQSNCYRSQVRNNVVHGCTNMCHPPI